MPNKYRYRRMSAAEFRAALQAADLSVSDAIKLLGRHYIEIHQYLDGDKEPTVSESVLMDFINEYPEKAAVLLDMAEVRITGQAERRKEVT